MAQFQVAVTEAPVAGAFLEASWGELVAAARRLDAAQIAAEFDTLFQGVGKPEVFLYGSFYLAGKLNEKPLVALRHSLRELGLARSETMSETEDHIASLCEVMRYLIAGDDAGTSNLAAQRRFFDAHLRGWVEPLCSAIEAHPARRFLRRAGAFHARFLRRRSAGVRPARCLSNVSPASRWRYRRLVYARIHIAAASLLDSHRWRPLDRRGLSTCARRRRAMCRQESSS